MNQYIALPATWSEITGNPELPPLEICRTPGPVPDAARLGVALERGVAGDAILGLAPSNVWERIETLHLVHPSFAMEAWDFIATWPRLTMLWLWVDDETHLPESVELPQLEDVIVHGRYSAWTTARWLGRQRRLRAVSLRELPLDPPVLDAFVSLAQIEKVELIYCDLSDEGMEQLARASSLRSLVMIGCRGLSGAGIASALDRAALDELVVEGCDGVELEPLRAWAEQHPNTKVDLWTRSAPQ